MALGILIIAFVAYGSHMVGAFNSTMLALGVVGLILAGVGASKRWERATK